MRRTQLWPLALCTFALSAFGCSDDDAMNTLPEPVVDAGAAPVDAAPEPPPADAMMTPVENKGVPLVDWIDDLLEHHTNESSEPDTVDDKIILDDHNPATFDRHF